MNKKVNKEQLIDIINLLDELGYDINYITNADKGLMLEVTSDGSSLKITASGKVIEKRDQKVFPR